MVESLETQLAKKELSGFDPKLYPMKNISEKVLERHPLLARWGGEIRGRVRDWRDLMYLESQAIIGAMLTLMRDHQVPSLPVHDSLVVPGSKFMSLRTLWSITSESRPEYCLGWSRRRTHGDSREHISQLPLATLP